MRIQEVINGKEITIIGTAHISSDSVEEVKQALLEIQPDTVAIELDDERYKSMTETKDWKEMGLWFSNNILAGTSELPESAIVKIKELELFYLLVE